ncbi:MAG: tRNA-guanine transglycosylase [Limnoraphis robusta]|uniref:tRNA-guanine transglycosylase n=2 Tax=Limnoraphis robusta TaxID=1118279 RepID=A0A0F5YFA7_9CYAN|nr:tRNA-guanine transglycosylase [Limnoraphis robusta]KKD37541.1 tRNA-guanine transglycosylase [Limnoraphis robusta CS-951]MEA5519255.1 tRNA-guanine transglycosylase [Limnoraphis robusta CCNP1315]MEA5547124.1 tRNA-guanine transglycosylase [Limnoraphis robusta CCNP1324]
MFSGQSFKHGRIGTLDLNNNQSISTPILFPVVSLITGTTPKGGGLWKYILQADESNGLLRRNKPVMSQVLHFLDFIRQRSQSLEKWREKGIKQRYIEEVSPPLTSYTAPLFLDSGGYQLLWKKSVDLSAYGLSIENGQGPQSILNLQQDFGGDIIATLDYPLPPNLAVEEAKERMQKSIDNAVTMALQLKLNSDYKPFLYVATHGQDREGIGNYVRQIFDQFNREELKETNFGLAVGSLVPLRGGHKYEIIVNLLLGLQESIPENKRNKTPIHVFGITGSLIPLLAYLGVDSFDSSTYVQEARSLEYINPENGRYLHVLEMEELTCNCRVCQQGNLEHIKNALTSDIRGIPAHNGHYKSKYYGDIALHNLEMDFRIVEKTKDAIAADSLQEYLIEHTENFSKLRPALHFIAQEQEDLRVRLSRILIPVSFQNKQKNPVKNQVISLKHTPDDFNILSNGYKPLKNKQVLLIIPCSGGKPYSKSHSHQFISERLEKILGEKTDLIQKVTLSGLYGPVPEEYEQKPAIMSYDFRLEQIDKVQSALITERLVSYIERYSDRYIACIGYATSMAYRIVLEQTAKVVSDFLVLPVKPKSRRFSEFYRKENVAELVEQVNAILSQF